MLRSADAARSSRIVVLLAIAASRSWEPVAPPAGFRRSLGFSFTNIARDAGLDAQIAFGGTASQQVSARDNRHRRRADRLRQRRTARPVLRERHRRSRAFPPGKAPTNHLYRNKGDGTFEDVDRAAPASRASGWGQGACVGDYDNDGHDDLFVTYWGQNRLYHNAGSGTIRRRDARGRADAARTRWNTGCAFLDYDRDGRLDLFVANYIDLDLATAPTPAPGCAATRACRSRAGRPD